MLVGKEYHIKYLEKNVRTYIIWMVRYTPKTTQTICCKIRGQDVVESELQVTYERGKGNLHTMSSLANGRVVKFRIILTAGMIQEIQPTNNSGCTSGFRPGQYRSSRGLHREVVCR